MAVPITPVRAGDVVKLKKPHPCGANEWQVIRIGMDIGLECLGCGRKVRLVRYEFDRRFRGFLRRSAEEGRAPEQRGRADETGALGERGSGDDES